MPENTFGSRRRKTSLYQAWSLIFGIQMTILLFTVVAFSRCIGGGALLGRGDENVGDGGGL